MNKAEKKIETWIETGSCDASPMATSTATSEKAACARYHGRGYQRSPSKQKMKLTRYNARGTTQRKGTVATSRQTWLVTASSRIDAAAASRNHNVRVPRSGPDAARDSGGDWGTGCSRSYRSRIDGRCRHHSRKPASMAGISD